MSTEPGLGNLYVVAAPSGTGKTTLVKTLIEETAKLTVSISHTTRAKRPAETEGVHYYFIDTLQFEKMIAQHDFLEHARVFGHFYGTSRTWVEQTLARGIDVILEIDWQGTQQIQKLFPDCISIFILPPSIEILYQRLRKRNQDSINIIKERITDVTEATKHAKEYDYIIMNDEFETAICDLKTIIHAGRLLRKQQLNKYAAVMKELKSASIDHVFKK